MRSLLLAALLAAAASPALAQNVHVNPSNSFISQAVKVPAGSEMLYVSGIVPDPVPGAPATARFGDTRTQCASVLKKIGEILEGQGYRFDDVVMMRVVLVGEPLKGGTMDFPAMMAAYNEVYGSLKNKPARITTQAAALAAPGMYCEIEVQAARPAKR